MAPFQNFQSAIEAVLKLLREQLPFDMWFVTRVVNDDFVALASAGRGFDIQVGDSTRWRNTFCYQMAESAGPCIFPDLAYAGEFERLSQCCPMDIRAYAGAPLRLGDGTLFGTLCAISRRPVDCVGSQDKAMLVTMANLLSTVLDRDLQAQERDRQLERAREEASRDALTGILNRRGWESLTAEEETRCQRYGHPAGVILIDLDRLKAINDSDGHDQGDETLRRTARVLTATCREPDIVARLGGDEFGVFAIEATPERLATLVDRVRGRLDEAGIDASIGSACRRPDSTLKQALRQADEAMYRDKHSRRLRRA